MAKAPKTKGSTSTSASSSKPPKAATEVSSIDDIFAKPKAKSTPVPSTSSTSSTSSSKVNPSQPVASSSSSTTKDPEKKKKKKAKIAASFDPSEQAESGSKVVEVVDPSLAPAIPEPVSTVKKATKRDRKEIEEDEMFRDSRGTGPRRKTEEGFLIYKEAELKIDPEAGGTPLCPFDCDCCF